MQAVQEKGRPTEFNDLSFDRRESLKREIAAALCNSGNFEIGGKIRECQTRLLTWKPPPCECTTTVPKSCNVRAICPHCEARRSRRNYRVAKALLPHFRHPQFLTLTVPNVQSLEEGEAVNRVMVGFRKLRQRQSYKKRCRGGLFSLEITEIGNGWHIHIHFLADFAFWSDFDIAFEWAVATGALYSRGKVLSATASTIKAPAAVLKNVKPGWSVRAGGDAFGVVTVVFREYVGVAWKGPKRGFRQPIRGDSLLLHEPRIIDRRKISGPQALKELCKYVTKVDSFAGDGAKLIEMLQAVKGKRLFGAVGKFYALKNEFTRNDKKGPFCCKRHQNEFELLGETDLTGGYFDIRAGPPGEWKLWAKTKSAMICSYFDHMDRIAERNGTA